MRIGVGLPTSTPPLGARHRGRELLAWATGAEAGPFSSLGVTDRLVYDCADPMVALAAAAAVTTRLRLVTMVVIGPIRPAAVLAAQAASLDALSGGRLILGLGAAWILAPTLQVDLEVNALVIVVPLLLILVAAIAGRGFFYYVAIASILFILTFSANTSFAGFPRVCRQLAEDSFLPHAFAERGRRLVFSIGIGVLAILSAAILIAFPYYIGWFV